MRHYTIKRTSIGRTDADLSFVAVEDEHGPWVARKDADAIERENTAGRKVLARSIKAIGIPRNCVMACGVPVGGVTTIGVMTSDGAVALDDAPIDLLAVIAIDRLKEAAEAAINDEPEFTDSMPHEMHAALQRALDVRDIDLLAHAMRLAVRMTKSGIKDRLREAVKGC